jgi:hypothetical protein
MNGQVDTAISAMDSQVVARVVKLINRVAKWVRTISAMGSQVVTGMVKLVTVVVKRV